MNGQKTKKSGFPTCGVRFNLTMKWLLFYIQYIEETVYFHFDWVDHTTASCEVS